VENNILKTKHSALIRPVFPNQPPEFQTYFYFGNTNSTFVVDPNLEEVPTSADNPMIQVYAGLDNIPYTSDDVFVYAPQFWGENFVTLRYGKKSF
jgi:hypothetical protein